MDIFIADSYLEVLESQIQIHLDIPNYKSKLARAAKCQASFLSQVLGKRAQLNQEHAVNLAKYWCFSGMETDYFVALVNSARASTSTFKQYCEERLAEIKKRSRDISSRLNRNDNVQEDLSIVYLSNWYISVVHLLMTIPGFETDSSISKKLGLSVEQVQSALKTLCELGYAIHNGDKWSPTKKMIHMPRSGALHSLHHSQWRRQSERAVEEQRDIISYTATHSVSLKDIERIRKFMLNMIEESRGVAFDSIEEELITITCDLFFVSSGKEKSQDFLVNEKHNFRRGEKSTRTSVRIDN